MFEEDKIFMNMIKETKLKDFFYFIKYNSVCIYLILWIFCYILIVDFCRFKFYRN